MRPPQEVEILSGITQRFYGVRGNHGRHGAQFSTSCSGEHLCFEFNPGGSAVTDHRPLLAENNESLRFTQPIDVIVHPNGRIYVADFGNWSSFGGGGTIWVPNPVCSK